MTELETAITLAVKAHGDIEQRDKNGLPYVLHSLCVMLQMDTLKEMTAAVLHDVVEDTAYDFQHLHDAGISDQVIDALACLTHAEGEPYRDYIERVRANPIARKVKIADLEDNMNVRRLEHVCSGDCRRLEQYLRAYRRLKDDKGA